MLKYLEKLEIGTKFHLIGVTGYASKEFITNEDGTTNGTTSNNTTTNTTNTTSSNTSTSSSSNSNDSEDTNSTSENDESEANDLENTANSESSNETTQTDTTEDENLNNDEDLTNKTVKVNFDSNLKLLPTLSSITVASIKSGDEVKVIYDFNNWIKVEYNSNYGWLAKSIIKTDSATQTTTTDSEEIDDNTSNTSATTSTSTSLAETKKGYINVETANVRESASKTASLINTLDEFDTVTILEEDGDWYKIESGDISGYVSKSLITIGTLNSSRSLTEERLALIAKEESNTDTSNENSNSVTTANSDNASNGATAVNLSNEETSSNTNENAKSSSAKGQEVVDYAKQYLGYSYVLGGKSPETGFDCSGFTKYVFKNFGYTLGSVAADQVSSGREVSREELQPGDLLLFYDEAKTRIGHVGIYMGNDEFIHAANSKRGVVTDTLSTNSYYNTRYVTARRIVE
jgi:N-acetylmuramoyl-L-alanine amidase